MEHLTYKDIDELRSIAKEKGIKNTARKTEQTLIKDLKDVEISITKSDLVTFVNPTPDVVEDYVATAEINVESIEAPTPVAPSKSVPGNDRPMHELVKEAQNSNATSEAARVAELARITRRVIQRKNQNKQVIQNIFRNK